MQRKNYILKTNPHKNRSGFAMIMAIIVVAIITTIMAISLSLTTQTSKRTTDLYLYEQAVLYSKSAAELALLDIANRDPSTNCANSFNVSFPETNPIYDANVTMRYVYNSAVGTCVDYVNVTTPEQNGSILMDITVSVRADANITAEPIRYFRRTIQKL
jgi:type II secretory pathway component PulK